MPGKRNRLDTCLKPHDADAGQGWFMCVPSWFDQELDIKLTPRRRKVPGKKETVEEQVWTQGSWFSFKPGQVLYDTFQGYEDWHRALRVLKVAVQVVEATPAVPEQRAKPAKVGEREASPDRAVLAHGMGLREQPMKSETRAKEPSPEPRKPGRVEFTLFSPDAAREKLEKRGDFVLSQDEFVSFLMQGPGEKMISSFPELFGSLARGDHQGFLFEGKEGV
jgi:hypothetical protein